jgi:Superinfection immunity protein
MGQLSIWHWIVTLFVIGFYFLPTVIAALRRHHQTTAIFLTNLLLGWTALGWQPR